MTTTPTLWGEEAVISFFNGDHVPKVLARSDNSFDIVWERDGTDLVGRHFTPTGNFSGGDFLSVLSSSATQNLSGAQIFQQDDGRVIVHYTKDFTTDRDIQGHVVNLGNPDGNAFAVEGSSRDDVLLDSTATSDGGSAHAFFSTSAVGTELLLRFMAPDGTSGPVIFIGDEPGLAELNPTLAAFPIGLVVVAYETVDPNTSARQVRFHVYEADGTDVLGEVIASLPGANAGFPTITVLPASIVVAWQQGDGIAFRQYDSNGAPTDDEPVVIPGSAGSFKPQITALNDGGFIVAWTQIDGVENDGSPELDIFLQRFDARGNAIGERVHLDDPGDQGLFELSIATLDDGRVIITYGSETGDSTGLTTLNFRIFDPRDGTIVGSEGDDNIVGREDGSTISGLGGDDRLTGRAAADTLNGDGGDDILIGGAGDDFLNGGADSDILDGGADNDILQGGAGNDILNGGSGNDVLNGGLEADSHEGGQGNDSYVIDHIEDSVVELENEGIDTVRTSLSSFSLEFGFVENLSHSGGGNFVGTGNQFANTITGGGGNDILDGKQGRDTLIGGFGNDTYVVDSQSDVVTELAGQGDDSIRTTLTSYSLATRPAIENLSFTGSGSFTGTGNGLANRMTGGAGGDTLTGGGGNDTLNGFAGTDRLIGGTGNDTYVVDRLSDIVTELANQGTDTIVTELASYSLATRANVENLTFTGAGSFTGTGNALANVITAGAGDDTLNGGGGNDRLDGSSGQDLLVGGAGNDRLFGGSGTDMASYADAGSGVTVSLLLPGVDQATGGAGIDRLVGIEGLTGSGFADTLTGSSGNNRLNGGAGIDTLSGEAGNDTLRGEAGNDVLTGGTGSDVFVFTAGGGTDRITDFTNGSDRISIAGFGPAFDSAAEVIARATQVGSRVDIRLDDPGAATDTVISIANFNLAQLGSSDLIFAT